MPPTWMVLLLLRFATDRSFVIGDFFNQDLDSFQGLLVDEVERDLSVVRDLAVEFGTLFTHGSPLGQGGSAAASLCHRWNAEAGR